MSRPGGSFGDVMMVLLAIALLVIGAARLGWSIAATRLAAEGGGQIQSISGINVRNSGVVTVDEWTCYEAPPPPAPPSVAPPMPIQTPPAPASTPCPTRVEFGETVRPDTLVCQASHSGMACKKLGELFPKAK